MDNKLMILYSMIYKDKQVVKSGLIEASSLQSADDLGRNYCNLASRRFISIQPAILVREESRNTVPEEMASVPKKDIPVTITYAKK
jgi:hypothetical protein